MTCLSAIPANTLARFYTRATTRKELDILTERVNQIARGLSLIHI